MMPKTQPLCADVELNLEDRILDEIEKNSFIVLPGKGGHLAHAPKTKIGRVLEQWFKGRVVDKDQSVCRACMPLDWPQVIS